MVLSTVRRWASTSPNAPCMAGRCSDPNGYFLIDRHPDFPNVWLVGGGSGHGFKHGPAVGEHVAERILHGGPVDRSERLFSDRPAPGLPQRLAGGRRLRAWF